LIPSPRTQAAVVPIKKENAMKQRLTVISDFRRRVDEIFALWGVAGPRMVVVCRRFGKRNREVFKYQDVECELFLKDSTVEDGSGTLYPIVGYKSTYTAMLECASHISSSY
jgi:hypothetical protein